MHRPIGSRGGPPTDILRRGLLGGRVVSRFIPLTLQRDVKKGGPAEIAINADLIVWAAQSATGTILNLGVNGSLTVVESAPYVRALLVDSADGS